MNTQLLAKIAFAAALAYSVSSHAQSSLSGHVKSDKGEPVPFAVIGIKNTQLSATTDAEGAYRFRYVKNGTYVVTTKSIGYLEKNDTVSVSGDLTINPVLIESSRQLDEVVVDATRVNNDNGMAYNNIDSETLKKQNVGLDAPYMLNQLPGVVVNSDAGAGIGYTGIRIRGSDGTRINVTINGVPVNDAESQGVYFVDMPDLVSSTNNIQVQRGVGASSNGAGAFGASVNFQTNQLHEKPYANVISTAGSYNTFRNTLAAGTGLLNNKFTLDARASSITSDGYIDRASSNLQSYYLAAGYYGKKTVIKLINFLGQEKTGQAWNYVPEDSIKNGNRTYNSNGQYVDANGVTRYYKNETDNYKQNNFQLHVIHQVNNRLSFNVTGHYTKGSGYYEEYKQDQNFADYNLTPPPILHAGDSTQVTTTDLVRRLWLDNNFAGGIFNVNYKQSSKLGFTLGGGYNTYYGKHFGRLMWAQYASNSDIDYQYSLYTTNKNDGNIYLKTNYKPVSNLNLFVDLQARQVAYRYFGYADPLDQTYQNQSYTFFNPKMGLSYDASSRLNVYASLSVANKEPSGDDLTKNTPQFRPTSEQLVDLEAGVKYTYKKIYFAANFYNMQYNNQLVLNGQIDNVGNAKHVNVPNSYRRGIELEVNANLNKYFSLGGNLALSQNKIKTFTEYLDSSYTYNDASGVQQTGYSDQQTKIVHKNTDISYSPNVVSSIVFTIKPVRNLEIAFINKYVSRQYLDNTSNVDRSIHAYNVVGARVNYTIKTSLIPEISFMLTINNILSTKYETNGYTYGSYVNANIVNANNLAPAAPVNFLGGVSLRF
jgi:iron complex outermembrane receptor protein